MTLLILTITSAIFLFAMVLARIFEARTGKNIWRSIGFGAVLNSLEKFFEKVARDLSQFDAKNIAEYLKNTWHVLNVFYHALQRLATEKITENRFVPPTNGNKAASFYLKTIKEHKEKVHDSFVLSDNEEDKIE